MIYGLRVSSLSVKSKENVLKLIPPKPRALDPSQAKAKKQLEDKASTKKQPEDKASDR